MRVVGSSASQTLHLEPNAQALRAAIAHMEAMQAMMPIKTTGRALGVMRFSSHEEMNHYDDQALARAMARHIQTS